MKPTWVARACTRTTGARISAVLSLLVVGLPLARAADDTRNSNAENKMPPWEKGSIRFGGFATTFDSSLGFGINNGPTVTINGESIATAEGEPLGESYRFSFQVAGP